MGTCDHCGAEYSPLFSCNYCDGAHCADCRLPENHSCGQDAVVISTTSSDEEDTTPTPDRDTTSSDRNSGSTLVEALSQLAGTLVGTISVIVSMLFDRRVLVLLGVGAIGAAIAVVGIGPVATFADTAIDTGADIAGGLLSTARDATGLNKTQLRAELHEEVNERRRKHGLPPLQRHPKLHAVAAAHSRDMASQGYYAHTSPTGETLGQRYARYGIACSGAENIYRSTAVASASDEEAFAETVVDAWMSSRGHRRNILSSQYLAEGFGIATGTYQGTENIFITQNFC